MVIAAVSGENNENRSKIDTNKIGNNELVSEEFSTLRKVCEDCSDKDIVIDVLRGTIVSKDYLISSLQKDKKDCERLIKLLRTQKQILSDKNFELRSGDSIPKTVKTRIVQDTLKGKHFNMTSNLSQYDYLLKLIQKIGYCY